MQQQKLKTIFKEIFQRNAPLSVREGTVVSDQIINPLVLINEPFFDRVEQLLEEAAVPFGITRTELLDLVGARYLVSRNEGKRARAFVVFELSAPRRLDVPVSSAFYTQDRLLFQARRTYGFSSEQFVEGAFGTFLSPPVEVVAVSEGGRYNVAPGAIQVTDLAPQGLVSVSNPGEALGGLTTETDAQFYERLRLAISSRAMDTPRGLLFVVGENFNGVVDRLTVVGAGDEDMERDVQQVYYKTREVPLDIFVEINRPGLVQVSINDELRSSENAPDAYAVAYNAEEASYASSVSYDWTETPILGPGNLLARLRDQVRYGEFLFLFLGKNYVENAPVDFFEELERTFGVTRWRSELFTDGDPESGLLSGGDPGEARDYWFFVRRGDFSFVPREGSEKYAAAPHQELEIETSLIEQFGEDGTLFTPVTYAGKIKGQDAPKPHRLFWRTPIRIHEELAARKTEVEQESYNLIGRPDMTGASVRTGILFKDEFAGGAYQTSFDRSGPNFLDGDWKVGISGGAAKTAQAGIYRHAGPDRSGLVLGPTAIDFSLLSSFFGDGDDLSAGAADSAPVALRYVRDRSGLLFSGTFYTTSEGAPCAVTLFRDGTRNLFWADGYGFVFETGDGLSENVKLIDGGAGPSYQEISAAAFAIDAETRYHFMLVANEPPETEEGVAERGAVALSLYLWKDGETREDGLFLSAGAYVPQNRRLDTTEDLSKSSHAGVGIELAQPDAPEGQQLFVFENLEVRNINQAYAQMVLELDVTGQKGTMDFVLTARGQGFGENFLFYGHELSIWDHAALRWRLLESPVYNDYRFYTHRTTIELLTDYVEENKVRLLLTSARPHYATLDELHEARLELDYLYGRSITSRRKTYGKTDLYVVQNADLASGEDDLPLYRPSAERSITVASPTSLVTLDPALFGGPVEEITEVALLSDEEEVLGLLVPGLEYRYFWQDPTLRGSMRERVILALSAAFTAFPLRITARVHTSVAALDAFFSTHDLRKADEDLLARHKRSVFVDIHAHYRGLPVEGLEESVRQFVYEHAGGELTAPEVIRHLIAQGAPEVVLFDGTNDLAALRLEARRIDENGNVQKEGSHTLLKKAATEQFVPGAVSIIPL